MTVRVRFAPSPTGYLHVGGARTALFNWLWARKNQGTFILRIEDTDRERSTDANTRSILEGLDWLGLHWDEGPYLQSEGIERHRAIARRLLEEGKAYRSFATPEALEAQRKLATAEGRPWLRDHESRGLSEEASAGRAGAGEPFAIRFRVPDDDGLTRFEDKVYGTQERRHRDIEDFALLRPDATPLYNHVVVCDDVEMRITDVIRGQDHLSNTHKQILLYEALGVRPPRFAHLPLINAPDRTKLSKRRHGPVVSLTTYRDRGFLPEAFRNFLALLGWSGGDDREIYTTEELIQAFSLEGIGRSNAILTFSETDPRQWTDRKALFLNQQYLSRMPLPDLLPRVEAVLKQAGLWQEKWGADRPERAWLEKTVDLIRPRYVTLLDFGEAGRAYFDDTFDRDPEAVEKNLKKEPRLSEWLPELARRFESLDPFDAASSETALRAYAEELGIKAGVLINAVRTAVTGRSVGPSLFPALECISRGRVVARLRDAAQRL
ncbi:MAG TPA: glutamate--tRNA ligase [Vicinamibacteria bacterium]|nr:glutamate--tRNA ligase [Vicinamibacteria bacterium]